MSRQVPVYLSIEDMLRFLQSGTPVSDQGKLCCTTTYKDELLLEEQSLIYDLSTLTANRE